MLAGREERELKFLFSRHLCLALKKGIPGSPRVVCILDVPRHPVGSAVPEGPEERMPAGRTSSGLGSAPPAPNFSSSYF